jgi:hypothetical protein
MCVIYRNGEREKERSAQCFIMPSDINDVIYVMKRNLPILFAFWWLLMNKVKRKKRIRILIGFQGGWQMMFECGKNKGINNTHLSVGFVDALM